MRRSRQLIASAFVSFALITTSTAAAASTAPPPAPQTDPWTALSMLNPSGATVLGGAAVTAAQPTTPVPSPENYNRSSTPPLPVILVWLAVIGLDIYLLLRNDHNGHGNSPT